MRVIRKFDGVSNEYSAISKPAVIIVCETEQDVVEAVKYANARELTIAVKGGGHHEKRCLVVF